MTVDISSPKLNAIFNKLATILATGLGPEQRERVLNGTIYLATMSTRYDEKAIFEALRSEYQRAGTLDFVLVLTERIRSIRSFYQDVGQELEQLEQLLASAHLRSSTDLDKPYVFVLMPFQDSFKAIYEEVIREILRDELGCIVEHADELNTPSQIIEDIFSGIRQADFLVADTTGKNPNVFYEIGYAHALGKKVILLAQDATDLPFDVRGLRHILYAPDSPATLRKKLKDSAKSIINGSPGAPTNKD